MGQEFSVYGGAIMISGNTFKNVLLCSWVFSECIVIVRKNASLKNGNFCGFWVRDSVRGFNDFIVKIH